ncbi:multidrug resistance-associated protein 1-like [Haliotis cracherodii]|uniref:multidrug resistance-associated protein 1-like n=1 Tax=Haliotis cracherodii TaxID=6455 RepID=UPI0039EC86D8
MQPSTKLAPCPEIAASRLSKIFFLWSHGLVKKANKEILTEDNIWDLNPREKCHNVCPSFERVLAAGRLNHDARRWKNDKSNNILPQSSSSSSSSSSSNRGSNDTIRHRKEKKSSHGNASHVTHLYDSSMTPSGQGVDPANTGDSITRPSLKVAILKTFWRQLFCAMGLKLLQYFTFWITNPHFMLVLMDVADDTASSVWTGVLLSTALLVLLVTGGLFLEHAFFNNQALELHLRSSLMTSVFKKAMNLHWRSRKKYSMGEMTNYMSSDAETIAYHLAHLTEVMFVPLHFIVVFYQLFSILGPSAGFGLFIMLLIMPINVYIAVRMRSLFDQNSKNKDEKLKLLNEVLTGMKVLKLYAWEKCFGDKLDAARNKELVVLKQLFNTRAFTVFSWNAAPFVISIVMFCGFFYLNEDSILTPKSAFAVVSLLNLLRYAINQTPEVIFDLIKTDVSIQRLQKFFREEEFDTNPDKCGNTKGVAIEMRKASFSWDDNHEPTLRKINMSIYENSLVGVVGHVGSGKTSLVAAVLGEIDKVTGHLGVQGRIAYVPQQAWIQNDSLKNNILFGKPLDERLYKRVIHACALQPDIDVLSDGDLTMIGERGINLSGGQKQRVSLARAVYNDADIYLFDDPLSAVDSHVGKHIFDNVIGAGSMLRNKTRILVTHNVRYLPGVDNIIVLERGTVAQTGSFRDLLNSEGAFTQVLKSCLAEYEDNREGIEDLATDDDDLSNQLKSKLKRLKSEEHSTEPGYERQSSTTSRHMPTSEETEDTTGAVADEEETKDISGNEKWILLFDYMKAFGQWHMLGLVVAFALYYILFVWANIWLANWTDDPLLKGARVEDLVNVTREDIWRINMKYLGVYSGFGLVMSLCILTYALLMARGVVRASRDLHHRLLTSILTSPMEFFETTPIGRITNRFSRDIEKIDGDLPYSLEYWFDCAMNISVSMFAVAYSTPNVLALLVPLAYYYHIIQKRHTKTSCQMRSLESKLRSPIESHFTESVAGADIVRAYRAQGRFSKKLEEVIDNWHRMEFYGLLSNRWLGVHMLGVGNLACAMSSFLGTVFKGPMSGALLGLGTSFSMEINGCMGWFVILQGEVETNLISMNRIKEYIESPNEAARRKDTVRLPSSWPEAGTLEFQNYSLRYRPGLDLVLRDISFTVRGGEKVGVVGRTGAGKSSLMLSLFRLVEPAEGAILIDGIDISEIGLHDLREKLAIIPQDPVLFTGSLRMNLDPQELYKDSEIWTALDHTHLRQFVVSLPSKLQTDCGEGGSNFSVGQRQLLCLARTLLRKAKVLVLDEATAAVDMATDDLIQQTIRSEFTDCTVLTIAHRLNTVMDYDRILVLDYGSVKELDSPTRLLEERGMFYQMATDAGLALSGPSG